MKDNHIDRRGFVKKALASSLTLAGIYGVNSCSKSEPEDLLSEMSTAVLGRTGVRIPRISLGLGSRFCGIKNEDEALEILTYALENGLFYWDTAFNYINTENNVISEERVGKILKNRRSEVFISTKFASRTSHIVRKDIENSLKRLQTDHFDSIMIHNVSSLDDVEVLSKKGGIIELLTSLKDEGIARFIGFSSHEHPEAIKAVMEHADFDIMLMAMNHYGENLHHRQESIIPKALEKGIGILLMKVVRPMEINKGFNATDLIRYALSIEGPAGLVIGMDSLKVVEANIKLLRSYIPMSDNEINKMSFALNPLYYNNQLEWMQEGYKDGHW